MVSFLGLPSLGWDVVLTRNSGFLDLGQNRCEIRIGLDGFGNVWMDLEAIWLLIKSNFYLPVLVVAVLACRRLFVQKQHIDAI